MQPRKEYLARGIAYPVTVWDRENDRILVRLEPDRGILLTEAQRDRLQRLGYTLEPAAKSRRRAAESGR